MKHIQETSLLAYNNYTKPHLAETQQAVFQALLTRESFTNNELAHYMDWPINSVTPRIFELRKMGKVVAVIKRPCAISGRTAIAWRAIQALQESLF